MIKPAVNIIDLPVYTTTSRYLGKVVGVEVDNSGVNIVAYQVATPWLVARLWRSRLIVAAEQVVNITPKAIVVDDIDKNKEPASAVKKNPGLAAEPTLGID